MADEAKAPPPKRVAVLDPEGNFGTVDASDVQHLPDGARVLSRQEVLARKYEEEYQAQSTAEKVAGHAKFFGPLGWAASAALGGGKATPEMEAAGRAGRDAFSAGIASAVEKQFDPTAPQRAQELSEAHPTATALGTVGGLAAGAIAAGAGGGGAAGTAASIAKSPVQGAISALGAPVESLVARALPTATSTLGKAGVAAATMGARGAVEGAIYSGLEETTRQITHDPELSADKIFSHGIMGGLLGGGFGAAGGATASLIGSAIEKAAAKAATKALEQNGATAAEVAGGGLSGFANRKANELAVDALGATKTQRTAALEGIAGGDQAVGDYLHRISIKPATEGSGLLGGTAKAGLAGRPADLLETVQSDMAGRIAAGFEDSVRGTPARFDMTKLQTDANGIYTEMLKDPTRVAGAESFMKRVTQELEAIKASGRAAEDGTMDAAEAFGLRSRMERNAWELGQSHGAAGDAYKLLMRKWDSAVVDTIDKAAEAAGKSGVGDKIRYWKGEYQLAKAAEEMAQKGAERIAGNNILGLREGIGLAAGVATGNPIGGLVAGLGGKILRERGAAMGAYALKKLAQSEGLSGLISRTDSKLNAAAHGLLGAPRRAALPVGPIVSPRKTADDAANQIAALQADPAGTSERMTKAVEPISESHPEVADVLIARQAQALAFLASKAPPREEYDPLAPHQRARMSDAEAYTFSKYVSYAQKPERFFEEVAAGKVTYEGAETAAALMPRAFAELQARTMESIAAHMARGRSIPVQERQKIGDMLGIPATPAQRPEHQAFLQSMLQSTAQAQASAPRAAKSGGSPAKAQRSALDMLEANGPGRRR